MPARESDDDKLLRPLNRGHCPDCGYRGFVMGPRGGNSVNIECGNLTCRARFNVGMAMDHHIWMAQRIPRESEGGAKWG